MLKRRIKRITIKNYRSITDLTVEMPDLMVLVGENGSGKSNFVDALRFLSDAMYKLHDAISKRGNMHILRNDVDNLSIYFEIEVEIDAINYNYGFEVREEEFYYVIQKEFYKKEGELILDYNEVWKIRPNNLSLEAPNQFLSLPLLVDYPDYAPTVHFLRDLSFFTLNPTILKDPVQTLTIPAKLSESGENLTSVLYDIKKNFEHIDSTITEYLSLLMPNIVSYDFGSIGRFIYIILKHQNGHHFDLSQESDGTRRVLAMLTALLQPQTPSLLAIEEPELFIHPGILAMLCEFIDEASLRQQIIVTTHSPDLIAKFDVNAIRVVEMTDNGTVIDMLDDRLLEIVNQKLFNTSDILSIEGRLRRKKNDS